MYMDGLSKIRHAEMIDSPLNGLLQNINPYIHTIKNSILYIEKHNIIPW